jgi:pimeloyl-ACP methyl ester carboxylesterase
MPYTVVNNISLYYEIIGAGQPLLFLHGLGSSIKDWESQFNFFAKNHQVIAVDLRGHGKSDKPKGHYSVPLFSNDVIQFIQTVIKQPIHLVGHSLGGMVAFQLAIDHPDLLKSLTIINSGPSVVFPSMVGRVRFLLRLLSVRLFGMHQISHALAKMLFPNPQQSELRTQFIHRWMENDPHAYLNSLHAFHDWDVTTKLSTIQCPTLIMGSDHDYTPIAYKNFYMQLIPNAEFAMINNSYHMANLDQPDQVNHALSNFLKKHFVINFDV